MDDNKIEFLALSIPAKLFTTPTLPSGKDIVRACNSHDALVEAATHAKTLLLQTPSDEYVDSTVAELDAALALASGGK